MECKFGGLGKKREARGFGWGSRVAGMGRKQKMASSVQDKLCLCYIQVLDDFWELVK